MVTVEFCRTMAQYNRWMNDRLYENCAGIPDAERRADRGAFFRSIHGTLNHLLLGDRIWLGRFTGRRFKPQSLDEELYRDFDTLRAERSRTDTEIDRWTATVTDEALAAPFRFMSFINPEEREAPLWKPVAHFFNHQTHHRGQLTTLLTQAGRDPGVTDLMGLPEMFETQW